MASGFFGSFLARVRGRQAVESAAEADRAWEQALACRDRGDLGAARRLCEEALERFPGDARSHYLLGVIDGQRGEIERSLHHLAQAVALAPAWPDAHLGHGNAQQLAGDLRAAEASYRRAIELAPDAAAAHYNLGVLLRNAGRRDEALQCHARAHERAPGSGEITWDLVQLRLDLGEVEPARAAAERTLVLNGSSAAAHKALGLVHLHLHEPQPALERFAQAGALAPQDLEALLHQGIAAQELGRLDEALAAYERALHLKQDYAPARWRRALLALMRGDFEGGWADYEVRHLSEDRPRRRFQQPRWQGASLAGKTLLVYGEQGLGDEIMFASCLPEAMARAQRVVIDCDPRLAPLFRRSFPAATVHASVQGDEPSWLREHPAPDCQIAIGSLPALLRRRPEAFPHHAGYLHADAQKVAAWRARLAALGPGLKVGLSWRGGTAASRTQLRSLALEQLLSVLQVAGVKFVNLQYTDTAQERSDLAQRHGVAIAHFPEAIADYDETAALVTALDLTLSVCTAVVHLAGALGRPAWVLTPFVPEWRYGFTGERMVWYPSVRLVRQQRYGAWDSVIAAVARDLERMARSA